MNHPIVPLTITAGETAKSRAAKRPALVPAMVLTRANITTAVSEPTTAGNMTMKVRRSMPPPSTLYVAAAVKCSITWDVAETSRPLGYQER